MKKNVWIFGLIVGGILTGVMLYMANRCYQNPEIETNTVLGYAGMLLVFSLIFVGIKNYRDKYNGGVISFGKAFKMGMYISLIAAAIYTAVWLIDYYFFIPDFIDQYTKHVLYDARKNGATGAELSAKAKEMAEFKEMYKNPLFIIVSTAMEVFPIGLVVSLISALILKRNTQ